MMETQTFQQTESKLTSVYNSNLLLSEELKHEIHLALTQLYYACCTEESQLFGKPLTPIPQNRFDQMQKLITSSESTPSSSSFTTNATPLVDTSNSFSPQTPNQFVSPSIKNTAPPSTEPVISPQRNVAPVVTPTRTSMNIVTPKKKKRADWTPQEHAIFLSFLETGETDFEKMGKALNRTIKQVRDHFYAFRRGLIRNSSHPVNRNFEVPKTSSSSSSSSRNKENHQNKVLHRDQQQKKDFPTPKIELDKKITKRNHKV